MLGARARVRAGAEEECREKRRRESRNRNKSRRKRRCGNHRVGAENKNTSIFVPNLDFWDKKNGKRHFLMGFGLHNPGLIAIIWVKVKIWCRKMPRNQNGTKLFEKLKMSLSSRPEIKNNTNKRNKSNNYVLINPDAGKFGIRCRGIREIRCAAAGDHAGSLDYDSVQD